MRRRVQPAVLRELDAAYAATLVGGGVGWGEARAALLAGRAGWQNAAVRNRFFQPEEPDSDLIAALRQRQRDAPHSHGPGEADLRSLLGCADATPTGTLQDICRGWPTQLQCFVSELPGATGRIFPRCGGLGPTSPYWLMSAASILPVLALGARPGDRVLDLCASPGGKSYALAQHADRLSLLSNDLNRSEELERALAAHVPDAGIAVTSEASGWLRDPDPTALQEFVGERWGLRQGREGATHALFDRVMLDVPCSTDKHLLVSTDATVQRELPRFVDGHYPPLQLELLTSGLRALRPGGTLVYCTCTLDARQNSAVVAAALREPTARRFRTVPLFDSLHAGFGRHFNLRREQGDVGVLVVPSLERNWGPLYVSLIAAEPHA